MVPGSLEPDTDYILRLEYLQWAGADGSGDLKVFQIAFHTSEEEAAAPPDGVVSSVVSRTAEAYDYTQALCSGVLMAQGCLDYQSLSLWTFEATNSQAVAWLVQAVDVANPSELSAVWPASCGAPKLTTGAWLGDGACFDLRPIGQGGLLGRVTRTCYPSSNQTVDAGATSQNSATFDASAESIDAGTTSISPSPTSTNASPTQSPGSGSCAIARQQGKTSGGLTWLLLTAALAMGGRRRR
jgi:hypothetical protein